MKHLELFKQGFDSTITEKVKAANYPYVGYDAVSGEVAFTEIAPEYEYVDLGLSVKWATCNVGASQPEEYGDYFAWGEVEPKDYYDWSTYKWCNGTENTQTKYCTNSDYGYNGFTDYKTTLELSDDAANYNWGGSWRMPTDAELTELREQCTWTWTTQNGVYGYKVTSKNNGNSIFLCAGGRNGTYWSNKLGTQSSDSAYQLYFHSALIDVSGGGYRCYAGFVRPV